MVTAELLRVQNYEMETNMTKADLLKEAILSHYKSVRAFALDMNIPYSTLATALDRGIEGMSYGTVIGMCEKLDLNPIDFTSIEQNVPVSDQLLNNKVMTYYLKLNQIGREKVMENMMDYQEISKYCV